jgi:acyl carrier protein
MSVESIEAQIIDFIRDKVSESELKSIASDGDFDLIASGLLSSLEFMELIASIEEKQGVEIDFEEHDPSAYTSIMGLANLAAKQESH